MVQVSLCGYESESDGERRGSRLFSFPPPPWDAGLSALVSIRAVPTPRSITSPHPLRSLLLRYPDLFLYPTEKHSRKLQMFRIKVLAGGFWSGI